MSFGITPARFRNQSAYNLFAVLAITYLTSAFHLSRRQRRLDNRHVTNFFAQHANGGPRKFSKSKSSGSIFRFSVVCVQRIGLEFIPMV